jgi:hypothetical protein
MSSYGAVLSNDCEDGYQVGEEPILKYNSDSQDVRGKYFFTTRNVAVVASLVTVAALVASTNPKSYLPKFSLESSSELSVSVSNEYGDYMSNMFDYPFLDDALLVEPYRETTFTVANADSSCSYSWAIKSKGSTDDSGTSDDGVFTSTLEDVGTYTLKITEDCDSGSSSSLEKTIYVKYVRRELSSLTDTDREDFLDAFHTLWEVNTVDGQSTYGDDYKGLYYFAQVHNDGGGNPICDEFHGGAGFVNNHIYLGNYLEQSLQMVNPKVALHYLDYTMYFESDDFQKRK